VSKKRMRVFDEAFRVKVLDMIGDPLQILVVGID
jgi:UDP-3-O-acyl-N-acetylglucosamine deacetylase